MAYPVKLFRSYYKNGVGLVVDALSPADGTETKPRFETKEPYSHLEPRRLSGPALWYYEMITPGQDQPGGARLLLAHIAAEIGKHARHDGFTIPMVDTYDWAAIIIDKHLGKNITDRNAAKILKLANHSQYQRKYKPREDRVLLWLRSYRCQAKGG